MFTFHLYGLLIGLAIVLASFLIEHQSQRHHLNLNVLWSASGWVLIGGVVGARLYHVVTDFQLYQLDWWNVFKIWQGGLGVMGAVIGGVIGLILYFKISGQDYKTLPIWLDVSVFGLPFAQALGRLGNYFNQELYGLPTSLPWGIFIDTKFRSSNYIQFEKFHPLFAYEALLILLFGLIIWWIDWKHKIKLGTGKLFLVYVSYYAVVRFWLEFLRIDRKMIWWILDINQLIVLFLLVICLLKSMSKISKSSISRQ